MKINHNGNLVIDAEMYWKLVEAHNKLAERVTQLEDDK